MPSECRRRRIGRGAQPHKQEAPGKTGGSNRDLPRIRCLEWHAGLGRREARGTRAGTDLPAVTGFRHEAGAVHLSVTEPHVALPALLERLENCGWQLASLTTRHASLDDVFVMLTGRQFEESDGANE